MATTPTTPREPKPMNSTPAPQNIMDPEHWSKAEKYDAETYLEPPYKKHLQRHANK